MSLENMRDWIGRTPDRRGFRSPPGRCAALIATLDEQDPEPRIGDPLPPLWHWLYFLEAAPQSKIGPDGHAERGDFLPPVAAAAPHVGGQPLRLRRRAAAGRRHRSGASRRSSRSNPRPARPARWCSSRCSTPCRARAASRSSRSTTSSIARPPSPARQQREPKPAPTDADLVQDDHARSGAAVPLLRPHLQRPSHPLRPALCHRHRRLSRPDRARPADGPAADRAGAPLLAGRTPRSFEFRALSPVFAGAPLTVAARREADGSLATWIANAKGGLAQQGKATFR